MICTLAKVHESTLDRESLCMKEKAEGVLRKYAAATSAGFDKELLDVISADRIRKRR